MFKRGLGPEHTPVNSPLSEGEEDENQEEEEAEEEEAEEEEAEESVPAGSHQKESVPAGSHQKEEEAMAKKTDTMITGIQKQIVVITPHFQQSKEEDDVNTK